MSVNACHVVSYFYVQFMGYWYLVAWLPYEGFQPENLLVDVVAEFKQYTPSYIRYTTIGR